MLFGGPQARIQVNDSTAWSGTPGREARVLSEITGSSEWDSSAADIQDSAATRPNSGPKLLTEVRRLLAAGDARAAEQVMARMRGDWVQAYQPLVDLYVDIQPSTSAERLSCFQHFLDFDRGEATEDYLLSDNPMQSCAWADINLDALCFTWTFAEPLDMRISVTSPHPVISRSSTPTSSSCASSTSPSRVSPTSSSCATPTSSSRAQSRDLSLPKGHPNETETRLEAVATLNLKLLLPEDVAPARAGKENPVTYGDPETSEALRADVQLDFITDGTLAVGDETNISGASKVAVILRSATNSDWGVESKSFAAIDVDLKAARERHEQRHQELMGRSYLKINQAGTEALNPRILFDYAKYLLIASSRPGFPPANLQGIWNESQTPPWQSDYTININTEMNYWAAREVGLAECLEPLVELVERLAEHGKTTARKLYGCRGWVAHHNTDLWAWALPVNGESCWADWPFGGIWLTVQLWEDYKYTLDKAYLERIWPLLKGAGEFVIDWLVEEPSGQLGTSPSTSPENRHSGGIALSRSSAMDLTLSRALLEAVGQAADSLGLEDSITGEAQTALARLRPLSIGSHGQVLEWDEEYPEDDPHHRHLSHLVGLYPLDTMNDAERRAAAVSLKARGKEGTGWSLAWKACLAARLGDGELVGELLEMACGPALDVDEFRGGLYPNLFAAHPPFQIDGNFGFLAAAVEALVQSHGGKTRLLPALPPAWQSGELRGLNVRGNASLDMEWKDGEVTRARITSRLGLDTEVEVNGVVNRVKLRVGESWEFS
jgi:alpha-L-fucosidase 2